MLARIMIVRPKTFRHDLHTMKGKAMGRGLDHVRKEGAKLIPHTPPTADDPYEKKPIACERSSSRARTRCS